MIIGADAFEIGRELRKALVRPKQFVPINPRNFIPIVKKDGRMNFLSLDNQGNTSYGEDCDSNIVTINGQPVAACVRGKITRNRKIDFIGDWKQ